MRWVTWHACIRWAGAEKKTSEQGEGTNTLNDSETKCHAHGPHSSNTMVDALGRWTNRNAHSLVEHLGGRSRWPSFVNYHILSNDWSQGIIGGHMDDHLPAHNLSHLMMLAAADYRLLSLAAGNQRQRRGKNLLLAPERTMETSTVPLLSYSWFRMRRMKSADAES